MSSFAPSAIHLRIVATCASESGSRFLGIRGGLSPCGRIWATTSLCSGLPGVTPGWSPFSPFLSRSAWPVMTKPPWALAGWWQP